MLAMQYINIYIMGKLSLDKSKT